MQALKIQLFSKHDTDNQLFYIGKLQFPGTLELGEGVVFFIYLEGDIKELHICPTESLKCFKHNQYYQNARVKSRMKHNNIAVDLYRKFSAVDERPYYVGSITSKLTLNARDELVFLVFVADEGEEELQISSKLEDKKPRKDRDSNRDNRISSPNNEIEVVKKRRY